MSLARALERARELGAHPRQERSLVRAWLTRDDLARIAAAPRAPFAKALVAALPELEAELAKIARVASEHAGSADTTGGQTGGAPGGKLEGESTSAPGRDAGGATRLLVELADGATIETVLLPKNALCISSQVGCAVGCRFCKTGEGGLVRNLEVDELLAQVVLARARKPIDRIVFMGMGEPAHNLANVLGALEWLGTEGRFAHKRMVFSTVGERKVFERLLAAPVRPALALSLHAADDARRAELLPRAPRIPVRELVELADAYARAITWPVLYQWTLLEGVNDSDADLAAAVELLRGRHGLLNVVGWNALDGFPFRRAPLERAVHWVRTLKRAGVFATLRDSAGQDVEGGCGQLRSRAVADRSRPLVDRSR
ncbi:MAG: RNA methyltransferase [Planctomycetes bacterium]|nr:RNA methyltransferase [Planctomycetota bacterium]